MHKAPTRRAALGAIALAPLAGLPTAVDALFSQDPIFAAIERHKATRKAFNDACNLTDEVLAESEGREVTAADEAAYDAASQAETNALQELAETPPTTPAGLVAVASYVAERGYLNEMGNGSADFLRTLARSPFLLA